MDSIIRNTDLGQLWTNNIIYILERVVGLNSLSTNVTCFLNVENISQNSAIIISTNPRFFGVVNVRFQTRRPTLTSMNLTTNLGTLENNNPQTIIARFLQLNPILVGNNQEQWNVFNIYSDSAIISRNQYILDLTQEANRNIQTVLSRNSQRIRLQNRVTVFDRITVNFNLLNPLKKAFNVFKECFVFSKINKRSIVYNFLANNQCYSSVGIILKENKEWGQNNSFIFIGNDVYVEIWNFGIALKYDNLDSTIIGMQLDNYCGVNVVTQNDEIYHLNINNLTMKKLVDMTSFDLKKEINLYYNNNKETTIIKDDLDRWNYVIIKDFNLGSINPLNYKKISFLRKYDDDFETTLKLNNIVFNGNKISLYDGQDLQKYISNCYVFQLQDGIGECGGLKSMQLQDIDEKILGNHILAGQNFYLSWYLENNEYHLQVIVEQEVNLNNASYEGQVKANIGVGIKLYNEQ